MGSSVRLLLTLFLGVVAMIFFACNSHHPTIYKMWTFGNVHALDDSKSSLMDNFTFNFLDKQLNNVKFQFSTEKTIKICDSSGKVISTGVLEAPDNTSVKFSFGNDSATLYKIDALSDTGVNLIDAKQNMVLHLSAK